MDLDRLQRSLDEVALRKYGRHYNDLDVADQVELNNYGREGSAEDVAERQGSRKGNVDSGAGMAETPTEAEVNGGAIVNPYANMLEEQANIPVTKKSHKNVSKIITDRLLK